MSHLGNFYYFTTKKSEILCLLIVDETLEVLICIAIFACIKVNMCIKIRNVFLTRAKFVDLDEVHKYISSNKFFQLFY